MCTVRLIHRQHGRRECGQILYSFDQTLLSISCRSQTVTAPLDMLNEIVATLEY